MESLIDDKEEEGNDVIEADEEEKTDSDHGDYKSQVKLVSNDKHGNLKHGCFLSADWHSGTTVKQEKKRRNRKRVSVLFVFSIFVGYR